MRARLAAAGLERAVRRCGSSACASVRRGRLHRLIAGEINGVSAEQAAYGLLAIGTDPQANTKAIAAILNSEGETLPEGWDTALRVGSLGFTLRTAKGGARPNLVGYLHGMCGAYSFARPASTDDLALVDPVASALRDALVDLWAPCQGGTRASTKSLAGDPDMGSRSILLINDADPIIEATYQRRWIDLLTIPDANVIHYSRPNHESAPQSAVAETTRRLAWFDRELVTGHTRFAEGRNQ